MEKDNFKMNLQLFAEDKNENEDINKDENLKDEDNSENKNNDNKESEKISNLEKQVKSMSDLIQKLSTEKNENKNEDKNIDNKDNSLKEIEELKKQIRQSELKRYAEKELIKQEFTEHLDTLLPIVLSKDEETTVKNIEVIKNIVNKQVEKKIENLKKGRGFQGNVDLTADELDKEIDNILNINGSANKFEDFWK